MLAEVVAVVSSILGFAVLWFRLKPNALDPSVGRSEVQAASSRFVSIVVPARNEEKNLPTLLDSFSRLNWDRSQFEVVLVDDESEDRTYRIAEEFAQIHQNLNLEIVKGRPRPEGWTGKNWACHQGFLQAKGELLLFTDADTSHRPEGLCRAVGKFEFEKLHLLSAVPFHRCEAFWEKLLGPFHLMTFVSTAAFSEPKPGRIFSIGQYLLFSRESYLAQGGHEAIKGSLCDDLDLADRCLHGGGKFAVDGEATIYDVRMYDSFPSFIAGWKRIFRLGLRYARPWSVVEVYLVIACLTASFRFSSASLLEGAMLIAGLALLAIRQFRFGPFSIFGIVLYPFGVGLFILISTLAVIDLAFVRDLKWRGRSYGKSEDQSFTRGG